MQCLGFFQNASSSGQIQEFDFNKYTSNSLKECILEVDLEYLKELQELHNDYPLAPDKIVIR